tara:strand:+ start:1034 stop:1633 length:600 start_codon:yes stop_codon:yes gene_type:complete
MCSLPIIGIYSDFIESYHYGYKWGIIKYGAILSVVGGCVIYGLSSWYSNYSIKSNFRGHISEYIDLTPIKNRHTSTGPLPKIVIVDKDEGAVDRYHFSLPGLQMATMPAEVEIIVWSEYNETFYDYYGTTKNPAATRGYIGSVTITIIDQKSGALIAKKTFSGAGKDKISYRSKRGSSPPSKRVFMPEKHRIMDFILNI